jgi:ribosomal protein L6P/L9E
MSRRIVRFSRRASCLTSVDRLFIPASNTKIIVSGYDKSEIGQFAATIKKWRPPEPYKGKGIRYQDEIVRRKEGKAGKKK